MRVVYRGEFIVNRDPEIVFRILSDPRIFARVFPRFQGVEITEDEEFIAKLKNNIGPFRADGSPPWTAGVLPLRLSSPFRSPSPGVHHKLSSRRQPAGRCESHPLLRLPTPNPESTRLQQRLISLSYSYVYILLVL